MDTRLSAERESDTLITKGAVGKLSIGSEGWGDSSGEEWHHEDCLNLVCDEPKPLESMYAIGCVVHDFINLTIGRVVPATLALYVAEAHDWRRFDLIAQTARFRSCESTGQSDQWLTLAEVGGLQVLAKLLSWCEQDPINPTILHRATHQWDNWRDAFTEHWRTLNMLVEGRENERVRITKLVDKVGKRVAKAIRPDDVDFDSWMAAISDYRNKVVSHPTARQWDDSRILNEGPVFAHHMEFLLKAFVLKHGFGIDMDKPKVLQGLKKAVDGWNRWDWRSKSGTQHYIY